MLQLNKIFHSSQNTDRSFSWGDVFAFGFVIMIIYAGVRLAFDAPSVIPGPDISLSPASLPWYALLSVGRMAAAYALSLVFSLVYGRLAAYHKTAEKILMPLLDILQSVPILAFLPVVLLGLSAIMPVKVAAEIASIVLIFTSQAWNLTFAWYQSLKTIPKELQEASTIFHLNNWMKFKTLELPFGMISLIWNSMMSWAGGWFFLMAAEIFTVGTRDFRLPGLGAYLSEAANQSNYQAIFWGVATLIIVVIILDQFVWRPLIAWSDRFKIEMVESDNPPTSWFYNVMGNARLIKRLFHPVDRPARKGHGVPLKQSLSNPPEKKRKKVVDRLLQWTGIIVMALLILYGLFRAYGLLIAVKPDQWGMVGLGVLATLLRVVISLTLALAWTIPVGIAIGTNRRLAAILQPIVQVTASIPATALFPVLLLFIINLNGGLSLSAIVLMLMGTQWYLLFNIIAGASSIPQDLKYTSELMQLKGWQRWKTLLLPAIFPYLVTGAITASGGAWNASIVAEYQNFGGKTLSVTGIGSLIAKATSSGDYALLLAATLSMILTVVLLNRIFWRWLYRLAEDKYRME